MASSSSKHRAIARALAGRGRCSPLTYERTVLGATRPLHFSERAGPLRACPAMRLARYCPASACGVAGMRPMLAAGVGGLVALGGVGWVAGGRR